MFRRLLRPAKHFKYLTGTKLNNLFPSYAGHVEQFTSQSVHNPNTLKNFIIPFLLIGVALVGFEISTVSGRYFGDHDLKHQRHGHGTYLWTRGIHKGDLYDGEYQHNMKHGHGVINYANGDTYDGHFQHNQRHGRGKMICRDGTVRAGIWEHDRLVSVSRWSGTETRMDDAMVMFVPF